MESEKRFRVFEGRTFEFHRLFYNKKQAKLRGEELKLSGDIQRYRVEDADDGKFKLWIH